MRKNIIFYALFIFQAQLFAGTPRTHFYTGHACNVGAALRLMSRYGSDEVDCRNVWNKMKCLATKRAMVEFHIYRQNHRPFGGGRYYKENEDYDAAKAAQAEKNSKALHKQLIFFNKVISNPSLLSVLDDAEVFEAQQLSKYGTYSKEELQYYLEDVFNNTSEGWLGSFFGLRDLYRELF